jgi:hypothetical protein
LLGELSFGVTSLLVFRGNIIRGTIIRGNVVRGKSAVPFFNYEAFIGVFK